MKVQVSLRQDPDDMWPRVRIALAQKELGKVTGEECLTIHPDTSPAGHAEIIRQQLSAYLEVH